MDTKVRIGWMCVAVALGSGCAGARITSTAPRRGEIEMWGPVGSAAHAGRARLLEHCPHGYVVDAKGADLGLGGRTGVALPDEPAGPTRADEKVRRVAFRCEANRQLAQR